MSNLNLLFLIDCADRFNCFRSGVFATQFIVRPPFGVFIKHTDESTMTVASLMNWGRAQ